MTRPPLAANTMSGRPRTGSMTSTSCPSSRQTEAYVELDCKGTVSPDDLRRSLARVPEVVGAVTVSGEADALVHMLASDLKQLERALERIREEPNVDHTRSVIVLSRLIDRPRT